MILALILAVALVGAARVSARPAAHLRGARNSIVDGVIQAGAPPDQVLRIIMVGIIDPPFRRTIAVVGVALIYCCELVCCGLMPVYTVARAALTELWGTLRAVWYAPVRIPFTILLTARYLRMVQRVAQGHPAFGTSHGPRERRVRHFGSVVVDGDAWTFIGGPARTICANCGEVSGRTWVFEGRASCFDCMRDRAHRADRRDYR